jgi:hypothetical protein
VQCSVWRFQPTLLQRPRFRMSTTMQSLASCRRPAALLRMVRPSLLDRRFTGDSWIVNRADGSCALCLGDYCLTGIQAIGLDLPSLNQVLDHIRHGRPRFRRA